MVPQRENNKLRNSDVFFSFRNSSELNLVRKNV